MTDAAALRALIDRLESAPCGSRELDELIRVFVGADKVLIDVPDGCVATEGDYEADYYTTSLDAALPGEEIVSVRKGSDGVWWARDYRMPGDEENGAIGRTEPLARRAAALRALLRQMETDNG